MPTLSIKDVPHWLADALRQRADRNGRSLQEELLAVLTEAVQVAAPARTTPIQGWRRGTRTIEDIAAELRNRYPQPIHGGPLAVDIVRADRDRR